MAGRPPNLASLINPAVPSYRGTVLNLVTAVLLAGALSVAVLPGMSLGATRASLATVRQQVASLTTRADVAVEVYDAGQLRLAVARRDVTAAQGRTATARRALTQAQRQAEALAAAVYQDGSAGTLAALLSTPNPGQVLSELGDLSQLARSDAAELGALQAAQLQLHQDERVAIQLSQRAAAQVAALAADRSRIVNLLAAERSVLDQLSQAQRAAVLTPPALAVPAPPAAAVRPGESQIARIVLAAAYSAIGRPYQWGAAGPASFDCSGLTMWAFAQAGISLPHSAAAQYGYGTPVPASQLQPGDLVFFSENGYIGHVGIYIGGGDMIDAPHTGADVAIHPLYPGLIGGTRL